MARHTLFRLLVIEYVASTSSDHSTGGALSRKDKRPLPVPVSKQCRLRISQTNAHVGIVLFLEVSTYQAVFHVHRQMVGHAIRHRAAMYVFSLSFDFFISLVTGPECLVNIFAALASATVAQLQLQSLYSSNLVTTATRLHLLLTVPPHQLNDLHLLCHL